MHASLKPGPRKSSQPALRVLLIEGNPKDADFIREALQAAGSSVSEVIHVDSLAAAVQRLAHNGIDIILADLSLPDGRDADVCRALRERAPTLPVVALTEEDEEEFAGQAAQFGVQEYLHKDRLDARTLARTLRYAVERKRTEESLRREREYNLHIVMAAPTLICALALDGTTLFANPAVSRVTDYSQEELIGRNWWRTFHPGDRYAQVERLFHDIEKGAVVNYEMPLVTKHGEERIISWSTANRFTAEGELLEFIGIGADVSQRKQAEEKLRKSEQQLRQAQKMEAVGRLAGGVAHDFNNLLTIITGYSQILLTRLAPDDPARAELAEIKEAGDRAVALTGQLLAFSRKQVVQPKVLDLNAVVTNLDRMLQRLIGEDILLATALAPSVGRVKADPGQIEQIIMNLAVNARDAMPRGGKLTFETADVELDDTYANHMVAVQPGSYVMLAVSDTGCGMDADTQAHIFEPFFTTKEQGKGTGLGLSTVYGIVKQSDGYIWCYSEVGQGTTFKIYLPRTAEPTAVRPPDTTAADLPHGSETVLVVEDEQGVRTLAEFLLRRSGYTVLQAQSGAEALALAGQHMETIHLLLTDVIMPGMSGRELAERLAGDRPGIKTLFMSGYTDDTIVRHGVLQAETAFITKPFTFDALLHKVRATLGGEQKEHSR
mgnify:CR=1 FL=1